MSSASPLRKAVRLNAVEQQSDQPEPPSKTWFTLPNVAAAGGFLAVTIGLIAMIIMGPKTDPTQAAALRGVTPSRFNPSIVMVTQTPTATPAPSPTPTSTPQPSRLLASGLAGSTDLGGVSMACAPGICDEFKSAFVWACWSGKVVESAVRPFEFITLSNLPTCIKAARLDGKVAKNQAFGISTDLWRSLTGSLPGFKMFVLDVFDADYPPPYPELLAATQTFTDTIPKQ